MCRNVAFWLRFVRNVSSPCHCCNREKSCVVAAFFEGIRECKKSFVFASVVAFWLRFVRNVSSPCHCWNRKKSCVVAAFFGGVRECKNRCVCVFVLPFSCVLSATCLALAIAAIAKKVALWRQILGCYEQQSQPQGKNHVRTIPTARCLLEYKNSLHH